MYTIKNKVQLIGHLGSAPEVKAIASGKKMARFSLATNESYKNTKGEKVTETQWHNLVVWGKLADIAAKYLEKGREVAVEGKLVNRQYEDKNGQKRYYAEIQVQELLLLSGGHRSTVAP
ncbi:single-stranded DNA-binding protein [Niabella pedocola]|uniref:Single-stranded DNA-binding protein n=1 Tax=Niabella pedocola TaxID=1752077 RepID=A0ABS8PJ98_9BACT|nr:single-stranded DNA-binding protein [Niabella pedocola]MCD2421169.1 single-stranded DNA-binding protein [Niabella pedocola]